MAGALDERLRAAPGEDVAIRDRQEMPLIHHLAALIVGLAGAATSSAVND